MPGEKKGDQNSEYPEAPKMVLTGVAFHGLSTQFPDLIFRSAAAQIGFAGVGKVASRLKE